MLLSAELDAPPALTTLMLLFIIFYILFSISLRDSKRK
jgi:hypothetical protein